MYWINLFADEAQKKPLKLILSEGSDERIIGAAREIITNGYAEKVTLIGTKEAVLSRAADIQVSLEGIEIIDPKNNNYIDSFANRLIELRGSDFSTLAEAKKKVQEPLVFGTLLHESNYADIHMCGAVETSAEVIRSFFHIIKTNRKEGIAASFFFIDNLQGGEKGAMLFSDCAVNITPGARQLARIAYQTGNIAERIFGFDTHLSLLSYSTKGSGAGEQVDAVLEAGRELDKLNPSFKYEIEMQVDAAVVPEVSNRKAPGNKLGGKSNVLIFPDLQSGNIAYKLVERLAGARAFGPVMVGLNKTATDLSRGCSRDDVVGTFLVASYFHHRKHLLLD